MDDTATLVVNFRDNGARAGIAGLGAELERFGDQSATLGQKVSGATAKMPGFYEGAEQMGLRAGGAERGMRRMEFALTAITTQSLGVQSGLAGAAARMSEAGLLFGGGSAAVLSVGAGFAALGLTLHLLEAPLRTAEAASTRLAESFQKVASEGRPLIGITAAITANLKDQADVADRMSTDFGLAGAARIAGGTTGAGAVLGDLLAEPFEAAAVTEQSNLATAQNTGMQLAQRRPQEQGRLIAKRFAEAIAAAGEDGDLRRAQAAFGAGQARILSLALGDTLTRELLTQLRNAQNRAVLESGAGGSFTLGGHPAQANFAFRPGAATRAPDTPIFGTNQTGRLVTTGAQQLDAAFARLGERMLLVGAGVAQLAAATEHDRQVFQEATRIVSAARSPLEVFQDNVAILDEALAHGSITQEQYDEGIKKLNRDMQDATKKADQFGIALAGAIGRAFTALKSGGPGGVLSAGSDVLGAFATRDPALALPAAILGVASGLLSSLFSSSQQNITIAGYSPFALAQMRSTFGALLVAINASGAGAGDYRNVKYAVDRLSRTDGIPRIPVTTPGPGSS